MNPKQSYISEAVKGYRVFLCALFGVVFVILWSAITFFYPKEYATDVLFYVLTKGDPKAICQQDFAVDEQVEGYMRLMDARRSFDQLSDYRKTLTGEAKNFHYPGGYFLDDTPYMSVQARIWDDTPELSRKLTLKWIEIAGEWRKELIRNNLQQVRRKASDALNQLSAKKGGKSLEEEKAQLNATIARVSANLSDLNTTLPYEIIQVTPDDEARERPIAVWFALAGAVASVLLSVVGLALKRRQH